MLLKAPFALMQWACVIIIWTVISSVVSGATVTSMGVQLTADFLAGTSATVTLSLWYASTIYQCSINPSSVSQAYSCAPTAIGRDCSFAETKMLIENAHTDATIFADVFFETDVGDTHTVASFCISDTAIIPIGSAYYKTTTTCTVQGGAGHVFNALCIDIDDCTPSKQVVYFDTASPNVPNDAAVWQDGTNVFAAANEASCLSMFAPTAATGTPTRMPTRQPTMPTLMPSFSPTLEPTTTIAPSTAVPTTAPPTTTTSVPTTATPTSTAPTTAEPTTASPTTTTRSPTAPPVAILTAADTTTTATTASSSSTLSSSTIAIITACASALFTVAVCICAAFYFVRKNNVRADRRLSENVAEEQAQHAPNEIGNDAEVRVPLGVFAYARENTHVEDTRGEDNLSLPAQESVLCVDARRGDNIELALAEVRVVPAVFAHAEENAHVEDTRGEDNLSLPAQESVLFEDEGNAAQNPGRRQSQHPVELQMAQRTRAST